MNDLATWTETGAYIPDTADDPFHQEPFFTVPPPVPPCDDCQHSAHCAKNNLACCAFVVYLSARRPDERHSHREPSAEWAAFAMREDLRARTPRCDQCKQAKRGPGAGQEKAITEARRSRILEILAARPGLEASEIAEALGVKREATLKYVTRLEELGLIVGERGKRGLRGHRKVRWSVAND